MDFEVWMMNWGSQEWTAIRPYLELRLVLDKLFQELEQQEFAVLAGS